MVSLAVVTGQFYIACKGGEMYFLTDISNKDFYKNKKNVIVVARFHQRVAPELQLKPRQDLSRLWKGFQQVKVFVDLDVFCSPSKRFCYP